MWCVRFHSWPGSLSDGWMDAGSVGTCKHVWQLFVYKYMPAVGRKLLVHTWHTKSRGIEKNMQQGWRSWNKGGTLKARLCLGKKKRQVTTLFRTWLRRFFFFELWRRSYIFGSFFYSNLVTRTGRWLSGVILPRQPWRSVRRKVGGSPPLKIGIMTSVFSFSLYWCLCYSERSRDFEGLKHCTADDFTLHNRSVRSKRDKEEEKQGTTCSVSLDKSGWVRLGVSGPTWRITAT